MTILGLVDAKEILNTDWTVLTSESKRLSRTLLLGKSTQAVRACVVDGQLSVTLDSKAMNLGEAGITHVVLCTG